MTSRSLVAALALAASTGVVGADFNQNQAFSYTMGYEMAEKLKERGLDVDPSAFAKGVEEALSGSKPSLSLQDREMAIQKQQEIELAKLEEKAGNNAKAGQDYLDRNKKRDGVTELDSGVQYEVLKSGSGNSPKASDKVKVHYHGTKIDGSVFDSSVDRGEPVEFPVNGVIPGFREALLNMKPGDKWRVVIPSKLAYGSRGAGATVGPDETLIFELELLAIQ